MANKEVKVVVSEGAYELGEAVYNLAAAMKTALADGFQPGQDVPVLVTAALANMGQAMAAVQKLEDEYAADSKSFYAGMSLGVSKLVSLFAK